MKDSRDELLEVAARLCAASDWRSPTLRPDIELGVMILWRQMSLQERRRFMARLDADLEFIKREKPEGGRR